MSKDEKHALSQREYLQKYLDKPTKTKKKSKSNKSAKRIEIIDDDIGIKNPDTNQIDELYDVGEDAPQIAAIVDERSLEVRELEKYKDSKWQTVGNSNNQDTDISPPRKGRKDTETMHETHSEDLSPPRRNKKEGKTVSEVHSEDLSPPRKNRKDMETAHETHSEDLSPPRKSKKEMKTIHKTHSEDLSPPRKKKRHHSSTTENVSSRGSVDKDISPPRRKRRLSSSKRGNDYASDNSRYKDISPPRRSHRSNEDAKRDRRTERSSRYSNEPSSHDRRRYSYEDKSPSRRTSRSSRRYKEPRNGRRDIDRHHDRYSHERIRSRTRHDEGAIPSRSSAKYHSDRGGDIPSLLDLKVKQRKRMKTPILLTRFKSKSPVYTSRYNSEAAPRRTSRDKRSIDRKIEEVLHVKKAGLQDARSLRMEAEELLKRERRYLEELNATISGKDAAPIIRDRKTGRHRDIHEEERINSERKKRDDERNEKYYKWGRGLKQIEDAQEKFASDIYEMSKPLARYADDVDLERHLKNQDRDGDPMLAYIRSKRLNENDKRSIGKIQKYRGSYLPNRFNIAPGYRWDGVDRSNGFEKRWFDKQNDRRAIEEDAYKWSIADM